jgi:PleD family two-component response regulator
MEPVKKNSILIADDDSSNLMELTHILSPRYKIYPVKDGVSALEKANESTPDLILLDVLMPEMNGFDVFAELKKSEKTNKIPVIFITGLTESDNESNGLAMGAADYIRKPFDAEVVKLRVGNQMRILNSQHYLKKTMRLPLNEIMDITHDLMEEQISIDDAKSGLKKIHVLSDTLLGVIDFLDIKLV